jgi:hypothetical protein
LRLRQNVVGGTTGRVFRTTAPPTRNNVKTDDDLKADLDRAFAALKAAGHCAMSPGDRRQCAVAPRWKIGARRSGLIRTNPDFLPA